LKSEAIEVSEVNLLQRPRILPTITLWIDMKKRSALLGTSGFQRYLGTAR
jgi:hypothetical protein